MKLDAFFSTIAPLLEGRRPLPEVANALYGDAWAASADARRLAIYADFCLHHRHDAVSYVFEGTARALDALPGRRWPEWVAAYFDAHPMHHVELNENGAAFAGFLKGRDELPPWVSELADFEWWEWQTRNAPRDDDESKGVTRLSKTVEIRPYNFDFVKWFEEKRAEPPPPRAGLVIFWRDWDDDVRREWVSEAELQILGAVAHNHATRLDEAIVSDLKAAGIIVGAGR